MPIEFDTLSELKAFCQMFELKQGVSFKSQVKLQAVKPAKSKTNAAKVKMVQPKPAKAKRGPVKAERKATTPKPKRENTVAMQVQSAIDALVEAKTPFSANDVLAKVSENNPSTSKPTVLSTTSKLLSAKYSHIPTEERPSSGLRPMKVYMPTGTHGASPD